MKCAFFCRDYFCKCPVVIGLRTLLLATLSFLIFTAVKFKVLKYHYFIIKYSIGIRMVKRNKFSYDFSNPINTLPVTIVMNGGWII